MNIVQILNETEEFCHYLTSAGTIMSIAKVKESPVKRTQSLSKAIKMAKGV
tara:strand:- start:2500 stop:2652 length:153 start_codon:yes stop_codon:yes gene_type:complete